MRKKNMADLMVKFRHVDERPRQNTSILEKPGRNDRLLSDADVTYYELNDQDLREPAWR